MSDNITKRVGLGTAYGFAKAGGYEGTVEEFTELLGNIAIDLARIENLSVTVTTLPAGSQATASLNGSVLSLGIPKGDKGDKGNTGDTGASAGFGTVSATVDDTIGTPSVEVTASGADTAKNFAFAFHNLKGQKGDKGDTGDVTLSQLEDFTVVQTDENVEPYNFRATPKCGHIERLKKVVGASVAFNQLVPSTATSTETIVNNGDGSFSIASGTDTYYVLARDFSPNGSHKYLATVSGGADDVCYLRVERADGSAISSQANYIAIVPSDAKTTIFLRVLNPSTNLKVVPQLCDLTLALGSTIADYVYSLEQATAGAGVAWLKQHFPKMFGQYNAYDAGSIRSVEGLSEHKVVGFNAFDEETELGGFAWATGQPISLTDRWRSKNFSKCLPNTNYYGNKACSIFYYDENKNFISYDGFPAQGRILTTPANCHYFKLTDSASPTYNHDICINISDTSKNGTYEPYVEHSYPLDSDLTLRGILKISNGNLYADGDEYGADGSVSRKYGVVDLGSLTWNTSSSPTADGSTCYYAVLSGMATDTSNDDMVSDKFICASNKYISSMTAGTMIRGSGNIYVASNSSTISGTLIYPLATPTTETADSFTENQICEAGGTEEFVSTSVVPVGHETEYPLTLSDIRPTANGNYVLKCTVSNGKASYEWVSA